MSADERDPGRTLVTGAGAFIGRALVARLPRVASTVVASDAAPGGEWIPCDVTDFDRLRRDVVNDEQIRHDHSLRRGLGTDGAGRRSAGPCGAINAGGTGKRARGRPQGRRRPGGRLFQHRGLRREAGRASTETTPANPAIGLCRKQAGRGTGHFRLDPAARARRARPAAGLDLRAGPDDRNPARNTARKRP